MKELSKENLKPEAFTAHRLVLDYILSVGGTRNVPITPKLMRQVKAARQRYRNHLDEQKASEASQHKAEKRKRLDEEISLLKSKKLCLETAVESLEKSSADCSDKAESARSAADMKKLIILSNSHRNAAREKQNEAKLTNEKIFEKENERRKLDL